MAGMAFQAEAGTSLCSESDAAREASGKSWGGSRGPELMAVFSTQQSFSGREYSEGL